MNGAVALARWARHHGNARSQQIVFGQFEIGAAATEEPREERLKTAVDPIKRVFEAATRLTVHFAYRLLQCRQRLRQVGMLLVEVTLALGLLFVLVDGDQIYGAEPIDLGLQLLNPCLPALLSCIGWKLSYDLLQLELAFAHLLRQPVASGDTLLACDTGLFMCLPDLCDPLLLLSSRLFLSA